MSKRSSLVCFLFACTACSAGQSSPAGETEQAQSTDPASAGGWCHKRLSADAGTLVSFEHQIDEASDHGVSLTNATSVYLVIKNDRFRPTDLARAVVSARSYSGRCGAFCRDHQSTLEEVYPNLDMTYRDGRFFVHVPDLSLRVVEPNNDDWAEYFYEIAVVVNGVWYKNGSSDVRYDPIDSGPSLCAQDPGL